MTRPRPPRAVYALLFAMFASVLVLIVISDEPLVTAAIGLMVAASFQIGAWLTKPRAEDSGETKPDATRDQE